MLLLSTAPKGVTLLTPREGVVVVLLFSDEDEAEIGPQIGVTGVEKQTPDKNKTKQKKRTI